MTLDRLDAPGTGAWTVRAAQALAALLALAAVWRGGGWVNAPAQMGPMRMDVSNPLGGVLLLAGALALAMLPPRASRLPWAAAAALIVLTAGPAFYIYPPFEDGAYFMIRYDINDLDYAPAGPISTALPFALIVAALLGAAGRRWTGSAPGEGLAARVRGAGLGLAATVLVCAGYSAQMRAFDAIGEGLAGKLHWIAAPVVAVAACAGLARVRRGPRTRAALAYAIGLLTLCLSSLALGDLPLAGYRLPFSKLWG